MSADQEDPAAAASASDQQRRVRQGELLKQWTQTGSSVQHIQQQISRNKQQLSISTG